MKGSRFTMRHRARSGSASLRFCEGHTERSFFFFHSDKSVRPLHSETKSKYKLMQPDSIIEPDRRTVLSTTAVGLTGGLLATLAGSDSAAAQTELDLSITGDETDLDSGESISGVVLDCDVDWSYDLPDDVSPELVVVELAARVGEVSVVASSETPQLFGEASGSESFEADLLADGVVTKQAVRNGVEVTVEARLRVENADGTALARESARDSAVVEAAAPINATAYGSVGGSGELRIETA